MNEIFMIFGTMQTTMWWLNAYDMSKVYKFDVINFIRFQLFHGMNSGEMTKKWRKNDRKNRFPSVFIKSAQKL